MDPIYELVETLVEAVAQNPFAIAALASVGRNVTGYIYRTLKTKGGVRYDKKQLVTTLVKYEAMIPAVSVLIGLALPPEQSGKVASALVVVADILGSFIRKLR